MSTTYAMTGGGNPWLYSGQFAVNEVFSNVLGSWDVLKRSNFALSIYPYSMLTGGTANRASNGYALGAGISFNYDDGKTTFSLNGIGSFRNGINFEGKYSAGGGYNGYQYFLNYYSGKDAQFTGTLSVQREKFSLKWENDVLAQSGDKFRSNATEIGWGDFIVGTNVYTTDPGGYTNDFKTWKLNGSNIFENGRNGTYENGYQISSPFYVGHKTKYGICRVGFNGVGIGDLVQNGFHHSKLPFIMRGIMALLTISIRNMYSWNNVLNMKIAFISLSLALSSCTILVDKSLKPSNSEFTYKYTEEYTGLDTYIFINGYYQCKQLEESLVRNMFYL